MSLRENHVIWITGFPNAGKTAVAVDLVGKLKARGLNVIHLDGDSLRAVFGSSNYFSLSARHDLARTYSRLAAHLYSQGYVVVVSVVAMFDFIYKFNRSNIDKYFEIYLKCAEKTRMSRDISSGKLVYRAGGVDLSIYCEPTDSDLVLSTDSNGSIDNISNLIIERFWDGHCVSLRADS